MVDLSFLPLSARDQVRLVGDCFVWPENEPSPIPVDRTWNGEMVGGLVTICGTPGCVRTSHHEFMWWEASDREISDREHLVPRESLPEVEAWKPLVRSAVAARPVESTPDSDPEPTAADPEPGECRKGHPMTEANVYVTPSGHRRCRTCQREQAKRYRSKAPKPPRPEITACPSGHEYTPENSFLDAKGRRRCRTCRREQRRAAAVRKRHLGAALPVVATVADLLARGEQVDEALIRRLQAIATAADASPARIEADDRQVVPLPPQDVGLRTA